MARKKEPEIPDAITAVTLVGFKSFADETRLEIRPLTLLAGANSSGKSSAMQPLLLMKQTEEASYDPGPLLLHGPHVRFTSADQILTKLSKRNRFSKFEAGLDVSFGLSFRNTYARNREMGFDLALVDLGDGTQLRPGPLTTDKAREIYGSERNFSEILDFQELFFRVEREKAFLRIRASLAEDEISTIGWHDYARHFTHLLQSTLHVPGLRGNPQRAYPRAAATGNFSGTFENYSASIIVHWQETDDRRLNQLGSLLEALGLSSGIAGRLINAAQIEILVDRLPRRAAGAKNDLVNVADVGFGVSQVLPVLVALLTAGPGQLVYIEQPELHLHPRAQQALAAILVEAAERGVRVVAETHSSTLLLAVQTLVAQGKLDPAIVRLHWFQRDARGATKVTSGELDELGRYGDWPEDFGEVEADADRSYLNAVGAKAFGKRRKRAGG